MSYYLQPDAGSRLVPPIPAQPDNGSPESVAGSALRALACAVGAIDLVAIEQSPLSAAPRLVHLGNECANAGIRSDTISFLLDRYHDAANKRGRCWLDGDRCNGGFDVLAVAIEAPIGRKFAIGLLFPSSGEIARARFVKSWESLSTTFGAVLCLCARALYAEQELSGYRTALDQCASAIVLLDRDGTILCENAHARELLAAGSGLQRRGQSVVATELADAVKLRVAIDHVIAESDRAVPLLAIRRPGGLPRLLVSVVGTSAQDTGRSVFAVLFICDPARDSTNSLSAVCRLYGLTPVETALACQIVNGVPLCDAAAALRIRVLTARGYLKHIFAKTGVNRQASFVSLMLSSSVDVKNESNFAVL